VDWRWTHVDYRWTTGGLQVDSMDYIWTGGGLHEDPWGSVRYRILVKKENQVKINENHIFRQLQAIQPLK
jgi:hypothetical protein